jgi:hypothetical protein
VKYVCVDNVLLACQYSMQSSPQRCRSGTIEYPLLQLGTGTLDGSVNKPCGTVQYLRTCDLPVDLIRFPCSHARVQQYIQPCGNFGPATSPTQSLFFLRLTGTTPFSYHLTHFEPNLAAHLNITAVAIPRYSHVKLRGTPQQWGRTEHRSSAWQHGIRKVPRHKIRPTRHECPWQEAGAATAVQILDDARLCKYVNITVYELVD